LGSGNHFLEIQKVDAILDSKTAKDFGIAHENQVTVMIKLSMLSDAEPCFIFYLTDIIDSTGAINSTQLLKIYLVGSCFQSLGWLLILRTSWLLTYLKKLLGLIYREMYMKETTYDRKLSEPRFTGEYRQKN